MISFFGLRAFSLTLKKHLDNPAYGWWGSPANEYMLAIRVRQVGRGDRVLNALRTGPKARRVFKRQATLLAP